MQADIKSWIPAREAWKTFAQQHPEFSIRPTDASWVHFQRTHGQKLIKVDVLRQAAFRGRMLADSKRFETAVFNLLSTGRVEGLARKANQK